MDGDREQRLARLLWLERIAARLPGALMAWDREHRFTLAVGAAFQRPNFTPDELLGVTLEEYLQKRGEYSSERVERVFSALGGKGAFYEGRFGEKWYEVHTEPLPEADGSVGGVLAIALDITERKRAQRALSERDAVVHLAASEAPMLLQTRDADLRLTFLAGKLTREFGIDPRRAIGTRFEILPGTEELEHPIVRAHEHAMQGRSPDLVHFEHKGRIIEARVEPLHQNGSGVQGTVSVWFDVTEERRADLLLRQHFGQLELAASHTPSILWAADAESIVTTLTGRALSTLGWDPAEMIGKSVSEALEIAGNTDPARVERLLTPLSTGMPISYETYWNDRSFSLNVKPVHEPGGGVAGVVGIAYDVTDQKRAQEQSAYLANYDALTGLPNRALLKELLAQSIIACQTRGSYAGIVAIDLDHFKRINDSLGLDAGDAVLLAVSRRLEQAAPAGSTVGRSSGDEFVIIVPEIDGVNAIADIARSVLEAFEAPFEVQERELFVRASAGVSIFPADGKTTETLIARADAALLHAKQRGRNNVQFFHPAFQAAAMDRLQLETDLRHAVERSELCLHYQPIIDVTTNRLVGAEALVRWEHPARGLLAPDTFIQLAEETGLIVQIGEWVLAAACRDSAPWVSAGAIEFVSVNVSATQLESYDFPRAIMEALRRLNFDPAHMELEFTESAVMRDRVHGAEMMRVLRAGGVRIGIDDFGTGYSSLAYLKQLPVNTLKIDRLFVRDITTSPYDAAIARAIIALAQSIDLRVIAEGVETQEQLDLLEALGCTMMQGYYFSKPVPADHLPAFFSGSTRNKPE